MDELEFGTLDINNKEDIIEYEKLLYDAYINRVTYGWIHDNYIKIDNFRLKPPFPYNDLFILIVKRNGKIIISNAYNQNTKNKMQFEFMGFNRNKINENEKYCEVVAFFTSTDAVNPNFIDDFKKVNTFFYNEYLSRGFKAIYGTCEKQLIRFHTRIGFKVIDEINTSLVTEYLIKMEIK